MELVDAQGAVLRGRDGRLTVRMPAAARRRALRVSVGAHLIPSSTTEEDTREAVSCASGGEAASSVAEDGRRGGVDEELLETLRSVLVGHVMRRVCKEAAAGAGDLAAAELSASKDCVSTGHVVVRAVERRAAGDPGGEAGHGRRAGLLARRGQRGGAGLRRRHPARPVHRTAVGRPRGGSRGHARRQGTLGGRRRRRGLRIR